MKTKHELELADVKKIAAAAEAEALKNQWAVTIAIVDDGGHLLWLQRLDGAAAVSSPGPLSTGMLSPVTGAWLTALVPAVTRPSSGIRAPGLTRTQASSATCPAGTSRQTKGDERIQSSGRLLGFRFFGAEWELEPLTAFYDWLYINALRKQPDLVERVVQYSAFTDIEFNPTRSINCQAYSAALFMSLVNRGLIEYATSSKAAFLETVRSAVVNNAARDESIQTGLAFG